MPILIDILQSQNAWVELPHSQKLRVPEGSSLEFLESGLLIVKIGDAKLIFYSPHAWLQATIVE